MGNETDLIEYYAARHIWKRRTEKPPSGNHKTWGEWYLGKFGRTVEDAAEFFARSSRSKEGDGAG